MVFLFIVHQVWLLCVIRSLWLTAVWMHPCQVCFPTLAGGGLKATATGRWRYQLAICLCQNKQWCHGPCTAIQMKGTCGASWLVAYPARNTCDCLAQITGVTANTMCRGQVVCLDGLNGGLEPLLFDLQGFTTLETWPLMQMESAWDLPMMDVDLEQHAKLWGFPSTRDRRYTWPWISGGALGATMMGLHQLHPNLPHNTSPARDTTTCQWYLGAPPLTGETENSPSSVRTEPTTPTLIVAILPYTSPQGQPHPAPLLALAQSTQQLFQLIWAQNTRGTRSMLLCWISLWPPQKVQTDQPIWGTTSVAGRRWTLL